MMLAGRGRGKIRPPRRGLTSPDDDVDFETMWSALAVSFREIHTKNVSKLSFEENYRLAYRLVLKKRGAELYERVKEFERSWLSGEVCSRIKTLLAGKFLTGAGAIGGATANERRGAGEKFLKGIKDAWEDHNLCVNMTTDVLMYMERVYCPDNRRPSIFTASMGLFRDFILRAPLVVGGGARLTVASILNAVILDQIQMDREGDVVDKNRIRSCVYMLEGLYETDEEEEQDKLYLTSFEASFLDQSQAFYEREGERMLRTSDAATYLRRTVDRLAEEEDRCRSTISPLTAPKIQALVEKELIGRRLREVAESDSGVRPMLDNDRFEDLRNFYRLASRVDPAKQDLSRPVQRRIVEAGDELNRAAAVLAAGGTPTEPDGKETTATATADRGTKPGTAGQTTATQATAAAIKWVEDVLKLKDKYDAVWREAFESDAGLQTEMTRSFSEFINGFARCSEYISLFLDENLRRGLKGKTEEEVDVELDKAIVLLRYVRDKDLFERYYKKHLSRRLLLSRSISNDVEKQMMVRMKMEVGNHFTQKMEGMFKDMTVSDDLTAGYKAHLSQLGEPRRIELAVSVLTSTFWPLDSLGSGKSAAASCVFPAEVERMKQSFQKFYLSKHTGRQLTWQANMGSADLRATFPAMAGKDGPLGKERRYEVNVSTYAMAVLMLFNHLPAGVTLSLEEIEAQTLIPTAELVRNLQSLSLVAKTRLLVKEPAGRDIKRTDRFAFNRAFSSKFLKLKVGVVAAGAGGGNQVEGEQERAATQKKNDEMRKGVIEAAIVRIMKQRKTLAHAALQAEVMQQLASRFAPEVAMVKSRVEGLIEREYLERVEVGGRAGYRYLA